MPPESMNNMNLDKMLDVFVKRAHEEIYIVKVIELPTFRNQRISNHIIQGKGIDIQLLR